MTSEKKHGAESSLLKVSNFCRERDPYKYGKNHEQDLINALKEVLQFHSDNCQFYRDLLNQKKFKIDNLKKIKDIVQIPPIHANFFKENEILSIKKEQVYLHLTSSGTTGQKSQIFFDEWSLKSAQRMLDAIFKYYKWIDDSRTNYLLYTYEPELNDNLGTAYTDNYLCKYAPVNSVFYALRLAGKEGHKFNFHGVVDSLKRFEQEKLPVRIFGFPAFFYFTLSKMKEMNMKPIRLHQDSLVFLGGGWKGNQDKAIDKLELYDLAQEMLGIKNDRLRDGFGSVEHCIPYVECSNHQFHLPIWSEVVIRDVTTLEKIPNGQIGYLNFISPYITSVPANSILMGDLASLYDGKNCKCELETPFFKLHGRSGLTKNKSCALTAVEILQRW